MTWSRAIYHLLDSQCWVQISASQWHTGTVGDVIGDNVDTAGDVIEDNFDTVDIIEDNFDVFGDQEYVCDHLVSTSSDAWVFTIFKPDQTRFWVLRFWDWIWIQDLTFCPNVTANLLHQDAMPPSYQNTEMQTQEDQK